MEEDGEREGVGLEEGDREGEFDALELPAATTAGASSLRAGEALVEGLGRSEEEGRGAEGVGLCVLRKEGVTRREGVE